MFHCMHTLALGDCFLEGDFIFFPEMKVAIPCGKANLEVVKDCGNRLLGDRL